MRAFSETFTSPLHTPYGLATAIIFNMAFQRPAGSNFNFGFGFNLIAFTYRPPA
jgi:hypothetical protein